MCPDSDDTSNAAALQQVRTFIFKQESEPAAVKPYAKALGMLRSEDYDHAAEIVDLCSTAIAQGHLAVEAVCSTRGNALCILARNLWAMSKCWRSSTQHEINSSALGEALCIDVAHGTKLSWVLKRVPATIVVRIAQVSKAACYSAIDAVLSAALADFQKPRNWIQYACSTVPSYLHHLADLMIHRMHNHRQALELRISGIIADRDQMLSTSKEQCEYNISQSESTQWSRGNNNDWNDMLNMLSKNLKFGQELTGNPSDHILSTWKQEISLELVSLAESECGSGIDPKVLEEMIRDAQKVDPDVAVPASLSLSTSRTASEHFTNLPKGPATASKYPYLEKGGCLLHIPKFVHSTQLVIGSESLPAAT